MRTTRLRLITALFAASLVVTACGGSSDDDTSPADDPRHRRTDGGEIDLTKAVELAPGTTLDLPNCPADWDPEQGLTDSEITLFMSLPESGPVAALGTIDDGMRAYFDQMQPIDGRKIVLKTADDAYDPARTLSNTKEALDTVKPFSMVYMIGTPNNLAIRDTLQDSLHAAAVQLDRLPGLGRPEELPLDHRRPAGLQHRGQPLVQLHRETRSGSKTKVAGLFMDNEFGKTYQQGMEKCAEDGKIDLVKQVSHDPAAPDVTSQTTTLAASGAQVIVLGTTGAACSQSMAALARA